MYEFKCPDCGHDASRHLTDGMGHYCAEVCGCRKAASSLYAAECERLSEELRDEENDHAYTVSEAKSVARESDLYLAERDAARAECRRWTDCAEQALVARDRYKAALEKIATLYDGFVGTSDYRETDEVRIARTALDAGEDK